MTSNHFFSALQRDIDEFRSGFGVNYPLIRPPITLEAQAALRRNQGIANSFAKFDSDIAQIKRLQESLEEVKFRIQTRKAQLFTALAPISLLPPEIIRLVFLNVCDAARRPSQAVMTLSHVSGSWRNIALNQSELWRSINVAWTVSQQLTWLQRSGRQALSLLWYSRGRLARTSPIYSESHPSSINSTSATYNPASGPCDEIWDVASRWRAIRLVDCAEAVTRRFLRRLSEQPDLRQVESLWLQSTPSHGFGYSYGGTETRASLVLDLDRFLSPLPKLRALSLSNIHFAGDRAAIADAQARIGIAPVTNQLHYLRIDHIETIATDWFNVLTTCANLRVLIISSSQVASPQSLGVHQRVLLPELETLSLEDTSAATMQFAALVLLMPKLRTLHLDFPNDQYDHPMFFRPAARCLTALFTNCELITYLQVARESWVPHVVDVLSRDCIIFPLGVPPTPLSLDLVPTYSTEAQPASMHLGTVELCPLARAIAATPVPAIPPTSLQPFAPMSTPPMDSCELDTEDVPKTPDPLLRNLRSIRLNANWDEGVRTLIAYRASVVACTQNSTGERFAFDRLGLMVGPENEDDAQWLHEQVRVIEHRGRGWRSLDDEVMVSFA